MSENILTPGMKFDRDAEAQKIREGYAGVESATRDLMHNSAVVLLADRDHYGENPWGKDHQSGFVSQTDYVTRRFGASKGSATLVSRLADALSHGVERGTPEYATVVQHGQTAAYGAAIKGARKNKDGEVTPAAFRAAVKSVPGKVKAASATPATRAPGGSTSQTESATSEPTPPTLGDVRAALKSLESLIHGLSDTDRRKAVDALGKFHKAEDNRMSLIERKASKASKAA